MDTSTTKVRELISSQWQLRISFIVTVAYALILWWDRSKRQVKRLFPPDRMLYTSDRVMAQADLCLGVNVSVLVSLVLYCLCVLHKRDSPLKQVGSLVRRLFNTWVVRLMVVAVSLVAVAVYSALTYSLEKESTGVSAAEPAMESTGEPVRKSIGVVTWELAGKMAGWLVVQFTLFYVPALVGMFIV